MLSGLAPGCGCNQHVPGDRYRPSGLLVIKVLSSTLWKTSKPWACLAIILACPHRWEIHMAAQPNIESDRWSSGLRHEEEADHLRVKVCEHQTRGNCSVEGSRILSIAGNRKMKADIHQRMDFPADIHLWNSCALILPLKGVWIWRETHTKVSICNSSEHILPLKGVKDLKFMWWPFSEKISPEDDFTHQTFYTTWIPSFPLWYWYQHINPMHIYSYKCFSMNFHVNFTWRYFARVQ